MRPLTPAVVERLQSDHLSPVIFCEILFRSGYGRYWTGIGLVPWNGFVWTGTGTLGTITPIKESVDVRADGITLTMTGIPQEAIEQALEDTIPGLPCKIWFGVLDEMSNVIADPYMAFAGRTDVPTVAEGGESATISLTIENRLIDLKRSRERRYTNQDQQLISVGDLGFEYVEQLQEWNGTWGKAGGSQGVGGGGPAGIPPPVHRPPPKRFDF